MIEEFFMNHISVLDNIENEISDSSVSSETDESEQLLLHFD